MNLSVFNRYVDSKDMRFTDILTLLFPPTCVACASEGMLLCAACRGRLPRKCTEVSVGTWALFPYHHPIGERIVHAMKFEGKKALAKEAGALLADALSDLPLPKDALLVPIPSSFQEKKKRGYDHIALICASMSGACHMTLLPALEKIRETERQVMMKDRKERLRNVRDAFRLKDGIMLPGKTIILIDDVTTTGATFTEAMRALGDSGAERIVCLALAH